MTGATNDDEIEWILEESSHVWKVAKVINCTISMKIPNVYSILK